MGRPKLFLRKDLLTKAIRVFWEKGFAETSLQDIERTTEVSKSGLYAKFKCEKDIFLESHRYYLEPRGGDDILAAEPKGWHNIERFLAAAQTPNDQRIIEKNNATLKRLVISNIKAELPSATNAPLLAGMILSFFSGLCIEQNLTLNQVAISPKISSFMNFLRAVR